MRTRVPGAVPIFLDVDFQVGAVLIDMPPGAAVDAVQLELFIAALTRRKDELETGVGDLP